MAGRTLQFAIRLNDYSTAARSQTYQDLMDEEDQIFERTMALYDEFEGEGGVTFLSVTISNLVSKDEASEQLNLFDDVEEPSIDLIIERLNKELNSNVFKKAQELIDHEK